MSTHNTIINEKRKSSEIIPITIKSAAMQVFFCLGLKNKFETAVVNKPSVFKPLKFYCMRLSVFFLDDQTFNKVCPPTEQLA